MKQVLLILALLCTLPIFAQDYSDYLSSAKKHLQAGDKEKAISCYNVYKSMTGQINEEFESLLNSKQLVDEETIIISVGNTQIQMKHIKGGNFKGRVPDLGVDCQRATAKEWNLYDLSVKDYYIATTEVTQELWEAVMGETFTEYIDRKVEEFKNGYTFQGEQPYTYGIGDKYPVYYISKDEITEFLLRLNKISGKNLRLPTSKEWIFAEGGGTESLGFKYSGSNNINRVAWYGENSGNKTHPVASKYPNELGLYDFSGNVMEWTLDYPYGSHYMCSEDGCLLQNSWRITDDSCCRQVGFRLAMDYVPKTTRVILSGYASSTYYK